LVDKIYQRILNSGGDMKTLRLPTSLPWVLLLITFLLAILVPAISAQIDYRAKAKQAETQLQQELQKLKASGAPLRLVDLAAKPLPDKDNAALVYKQAFDTKVQSYGDIDIYMNVMEDKADLRDPQILAKAQQTLKALRPKLRLLHQAAGMEQCDFGFARNEDLMLADSKIMNKNAQLREAARSFNFEAAMLVQAGQPDTALAVCVDSFRLALATTDPFLASRFTASFLTGSAQSRMRKILSTTDPSAAACKAGATALAQIDLSQQLHRALEGERIRDIDVYNLIRKEKSPLQAALDMSDTKIIDYGFPKQNQYAVRWWLASDELGYLKITQSAIDRAQLPYWEYMKIHPTVDEQKTALPFKPPYVVAESLLQYVGDNIMALRDRTTANKDLAMIALLLKAYRLEQGQYPDNLEVLNSALPVDPFTGKSYSYRKAASGFILYSWGPNQKDDGGKSAEAQWLEKGDLVFKCER
jgi:hypothetical protein